jgi:hypothetical protein
LSTSTIQSPYPGMQYVVDRGGKMLLRLHYSADPEKAVGDPIFVPELNLSLSPWAHKEYLGMTNKGLYKQEYEIDGSATQGAKIYNLDEEATLEDSFPIPPHWTRRMGLDPHPSVPHAFLWVATDPYGDRYYYRELWPSKTCFRYEGELLVGRAGPCPEEDNRFTIREYVSTVRYLESSENPENRTSYDDRGQAFNEKIHARVIDYAARAFAADTREGQRQRNFQQVYELHMSGMCKSEGICEHGCQPISPAYFEDSKKDHAVGEELVNNGLKPLMVMDSTGNYRRRSKIHIFRDRCPELIYQLKNARRQQLTPLQAERMDPTGKAVAVRLHMGDNIRYLEMSNPTFVEPIRSSSGWAPPADGIGY